MPAPKSLSRVYFDVSGKSIWTRPETLKKSVRLWNIYQDRLKHPHSDGTVDGHSEKNPIRMDRDPDGFRQVLNYMRDARYPFEPDFEYELQYYQVEYEGLFESDSEEEDGPMLSSDDDSVYTDDEDDRGRSPVRRPPSKANY